MVELQGRVSGSQGPKAKYSSPLKDRRPPPVDVQVIIKKCLAAREDVAGNQVALEEHEICWLCHELKKIFSKQPMLLDLTTPMKVVGDIHGQYDDLLKLIDHHGPPETVKYLFMGNYVDYGGEYSV